MNVALVFERGVSEGGSMVNGVAADIAAWARDTTGPDGATRFDDPLVAERIGRIAVEEEVGRLLRQRGMWLAEQGGLPGVEGSMAKLFASEASQRHYSDILDILGAEGVMQREAVGAPLAGKLENEFRESVVSTIYGGSSEILREIVAERRLGLPRNRPRANR
jgi:alkylation response protein AidB-like acyl-CoA dehydrogenase